MTSSRRLARPPITEALIDLRVDGAEPATIELTQELTSRLSNDYPQVREQRRFEATIGVAEGQHPEAMAQDLGLRGALFTSGDGKLTAQFRSDGFTFNRLHPYTSWEEIYPEAMRLWAEFLDVFRPERVTRVAVRYINHIQLPGGELQLSEYLNSPIIVPRGMPAKLTGFLNSVLLSDGETGCSARVTHSLEPQTQAGFVLLLDIDAFQEGDWGPADESIESALGSLRSLKNNVFFSSLTSQALKRFE
jgi:uncharacterized protein (TIGR04255 family)